LKRSMQYVFMAYSISILWVYHGRNSPRNNLVKSSFQKICAWRRISFYKEIAFDYESVRNYMLIICDDRNFYVAYCIEWTENKKKPTQLRRIKTLSLLYAYEKVIHVYIFCHDYWT
jgi:hypothetical protein